VRHVALGSDRKPTRKNVLGDRLHVGCDGTRCAPRLIGVRRVGPNRMNNLLKAHRRRSRRSNKLRLFRAAATRQNKNPDNYLAAVKLHQPESGCGLNEWMA
jgi:hypothetical protein